MNLGIPREIYKNPTGAWCFNSKVVSVTRLSRGDSIKKTLKNCLICTCTQQPSKAYCSSSANICLFFSGLRHLFVCLWPRPSRHCSACRHWRCENAIQYFWKSISFSSSNHILFILFIFFIFPPQSTYCAIFHILFPPQTTWDLRWWASTLAARHPFLIFSSSFFSSFPPRLFVHEPSASLSPPFHYLIK